MKRANVVRASLEELRFDYEDYLRQRNSETWKSPDERRQQLIDRRCSTAAEIARWVKDIFKQYGEGGQDGPPTTSTLSVKHIDSKTAVNDKPVWSFIKNQN